MNYYTTTEKLNNYRGAPHCSQSFLKLVLANNVKKKFKETVQMCIGSYLDGLLTTPHIADEMFQVGLAKRPSEAIKGFLDRLWVEQQEVISSDLDVEGYRNRILEFVKEVDYQPKWGEDAVWKSILKDGEDYWRELCLSQGKMIITREEYTLCTTIAALTLSSPITAKYFIDQKNVKKFFQLDLYWMSEGEACKGLLDLVIVEHETKTIYIIDIKSTSIYSLEEWFRMASQKGYIFQMSFYLEGILQYYSGLIEQGYKIQCRWMVLPMNTENFKPWIIPCTDLMLNFGKHGYTKHTNVYYQEDDRGDLFGARKIKGWVEAIQTYKRAKSEELVDFDLRWFDNQGKLPEKQSDELFFN